MKLQQLTIHNIASIEDAVINFEANPLADSDVFLITGKTGSGKSTILDAICLALYGDTPRLANTQMQGKLAIDSTEVTVSDPRQLLRKLTGEGHVILTFTGSNMVRYEATWGIARAHKKPEGKLQSTTWQLKNLDTNITLTKQADVKAEMALAIGLDFNQFCRTTMLAQGEFTRFLNSKDDDKASILEKITGMDIYSKIGAKIFEITKQKREDWENSNRRCKDITLFTPEEIEAKKQEVENLNALIKKDDEESKSASKKFAWLEEEATKSKSLEDAKTNLQAALDVTNSDQFKADKQVVEQWKQTIDARATMQKMQYAQKNQEKFNKELSTLAQDFSQLLGGKNYAQKELDEIKSTILQLESVIANEAKNASIYEKDQTIATNLKTINETRDSIAKIDKQIAADKQALEATIKPAFDKATNEAVSAKAELVKCEDALKTQNQIFEAYNLSALHAQQSDCNLQKSKIETAKDRINVLKNAERQHEENRKNLDALNASIEDQKKKASAIEAPLHEAEVKLNNCKESLERQRDTVDKFAANLRAKLHIGDVCPVCQQTISSELPLEEHLSALFAEHEAAYNDAQKEYDKLQKEHQKINAEIVAFEKNYNAQIATFSQDKSVEIAHKNATEACSAVGINSLDGYVMDALNSKLAEVSAKIDELKIAITKAEEQEKVVKQLQKQCNEARKQAEQLDKAMQSAKDAVTNCESKIASHNSRREEMLQNLSAAEKEVANIITSDDWEISWQASPLEFRDFILSAAKKYRNNVQELQNLTNKANAASDNIRNIDSIISNIIKAMPEWSELAAGEAIKIEALSTRASEINANATSAKNQFAAATEEFSSSKAQLDAFLAENNTMNAELLDKLNTYSQSDIKSKEDEIQLKQTVVSQNEALLKQATEDLRLHQEQKPSFEEDENAETLKSKIEKIELQKQEYNKQIGSITTELKDNDDKAKNLSALKEEVEAKNAIYQKWSRLESLVGDAQGKNFRKIAQSYVLANLIEAANVYMEMLSNRFSLKVTPGTLIISVVDAYQDFTARPASTISGGESFLVSLSLALALSDIGEGLSVDTLFIDEGFGTLSGEPLQNAINTLQSLRAKAGRHVGIISHIEELRERVPVQIQVNQDGNSSRSTINVIPEE